MLLIVILLALLSYDNATTTGITCASGCFLSECQGTSIRTWEVSACPLSVLAKPWRRKDKYISSSYPDRMHVRKFFFYKTRRIADCDVLANCFTQHSVLIS
ncbi:hypothetical protein XENOCAPTIV_009894 [Xenoophorus captivus]|uniref:Secreted protein n=1 Tax=Xenoophorus captivus TaxID=1517983 RepID=A0ABV0SAB1_9TELE